LNALPTREAAEIVGVDHATIARDRVAYATPEQHPLRKERDGKAEAKRLDRAAREAAVANATPEPDIREGALARESRALPASEPRSASPPIVNEPAAVN